MSSPNDKPPHDFREADNNTGYEPSEHFCLMEKTATYTLFEDDRRRAVKLDSD